MFLFLLFLTTSCRFTHFQVKRKANGHQHVVASNDNVLLFYRDMEKLMRNMNRNSNDSVWISKVHVLTKNVVQLYGYIQKQFNQQITFEADKQLTQQIRKVLELVREMRQYKRDGNKVVGSQNAVLGDGNIVSGNNNKVIGLDNQLNGNNSLLGGIENTAVTKSAKISAKNTVVMGSTLNINGQDSVVFALNKKVRGKNKLVVGDFDIDCSKLDQGVVKVRDVRRFKRIC